MTPTLLSLYSTDKLSLSILILFFFFFITLTFSNISSFKSSRWPPPPLPLYLPLFATSVPSLQSLICPFSSPRPPSLTAFICFLLEELLFLSFSF